MTKIYLNIEADNPTEFREVLAELLGSTSLANPSPDFGAQAAGSTSTSEVLRSSTETANTTQQRERGKPAQGRARRTKEEIAEDEEADRQDAARAAAGTETGAVVADRQISQAPEDRQDPDNPQDAADEAAETEAAKVASGKTYTHDDARGALGAYVKAYGMPAALEDGPKILSKLFDGVEKVSAIPSDQGSLAKAVNAIEAAVKDNPFERAADL